MVEAVGARDYPVIMAATAVSAGLVVLGNVLGEGLAAWADPRLRSASGGP
jgi:ABC-type dipeptide/oligopeptide/nickel transport system permease component